MNKEDRKLYHIRTILWSGQMSHMMIIPSLIALYYLNYHVMFWLLLVVTLLGDVYFVKLTSDSERIAGMKQ